MAVVLALGAAAPALTHAQDACNGEPTGVKLHVIVEGVRSDKGVMTATVYGDDARKFLKADGQVKVWREDAKSPTMTMCSWLPAVGHYSVVLYHDNKRAYRFVRGTFGPTQDYGFSRNPAIFFSPPSLASTLFTAAEGETTIHIKLRYAF